MGGVSFCEGFHQVVHGFNWIVQQLNEHECLENHSDTALQTTVGLHSYLLYPHCCYKNPGLPSSDRQIAPSATLAEILATHLCVTGILYIDFPCASGNDSFLLPQSSCLLPTEPELLPRTFQQDQSLPCSWIVWICLPSTAHLWSPPAWTLLSTFNLKIINFYNKFTKKLFSVYLSLFGTNVNNPSRNIYLCTPLTSGAHKESTQKGSIHYTEYKYQPFNFVNTRIITLCKSQSDVSANI